MQECRFSDKFLTKTVCSSFLFSFCRVIKYSIIVDFFVGFLTIHNTRNSLNHAVIQYQTASHTVTPQCAVSW